MTRISQAIEKVKKEDRVSIEESRSLYEAAMTLLERRCIEMPVVDRNGRVVGMIGEQDLLKAMKGPLRLEEMIVKQVMVPSPSVIEEGTTLSEASRLMQSIPGYRIPVVKKGILSGTLTRHDILRLMLGVGFDVLDTA
jgi:CBS domain-containing protein